MANNYSNTGNNNNIRNRQKGGYRIIDSIVEYDIENNTLYVKLTDQKIVSTISLGDSVFIDISDNNKPAGIKYILTNRDPEKIKALQSLFLS